MELVRLYVSPELTGRRIGPLLMRALLERAARDGFDSCRVKVLVQIREAIAFYARWGFTRSPSLW
ncbi:MAG: GNAT family N-acetyltransferase [Bryobacteraceae bacterium]